MDGAMVLSVVWVTIVVSLGVVFLFHKKGEEVEPQTLRIRIVNSWSRLFCVAAAMVSWSVNQSIWWAIVHGGLGWIYLVYYGLGYGR